MITFSGSISNKMAININQKIKLYYVIEDLKYFMYITINMGLHYLQARENLQKFIDTYELSCIYFFF